MRTTNSDSNNIPTEIPMSVSNPATGDKTQQQVVNNTNEHEQCEKLFEESTHYYLIYGEDWNMWILGIFVIIIQFILYGVIINQGVGDYSDDQVSVSITWDECSYHEGDLTNGILYAVQNQSISLMNGNNYDFSNGQPPKLVCEADEHSPGALYLAMILAAIFLQYDYLASLKILFLDNHGKKCSWSKFAAFLILCEALMATFACAIFALNGWFDGSVYDAIMNTIGVLFIHDIDEKVYESVGIIQPNDKRFACCGKIGQFVRKCMKSWCTLLFICIIVVLTAYPMQLSTQLIF